MGEPVNAGGMEPETIQRRFVTVTGRWGQRQVHCRVGGSGPLLLLLHQSPQSSRELLPLLRQWSHHFTVLAPDSPGYGLSDPLGVDEASLGDFAEATLEFLDAIGAGKFCVYGFHTGGMIGIALAERYPERVLGLACNGVAVPTAPEREEILAEYLPAFEPRWDGSHLAWLWARIREQTIFFPWHIRTAATRMSFPMPPPDRQQTSVLEFLRAADHYHVAYRAAFLYPVADVVRTLRVPVLLTAAAWDPLYAHLARLTTAAPSVSIVPSATAGEALERCLEFVLAHAGPSVTLQFACLRHDLRLWRDTVTVPGGTAHLLRGGPVGVPVLVLHEAGGSTETVRVLADALVDQRTVLALDLPGHGEGDLQGAGAEASVAGGAVAALAVLDALNLPAVDVLGVEAGSCVALELARIAPRRVRRVVMLDPPACEHGVADAIRDQGLPSLAPDWHGGHLSRCWHMLRDGRLFFPWFRRDPQSIRPGEPELDNRRLQLEVTERLKAEGSWQPLLASALVQNIAEKLATLEAEVALAASAASPWYAGAAAVAVGAGRRFVALPPEPAHQRRAIAALFAGNGPLPGRDS